MLAGYPPFFDENPFAIYEKILVRKVDWPRPSLDATAKDLVNKLLAKDRTKRLGNMKVTILHCHLGLGAPLIVKAEKTCSSNFVFCKFVFVFGITLLFLS